MKLSDHFTLEALCDTTCGLDNSLDPDSKEGCECIENLRRLVELYLEPLRVFYRKPFVIISAYRKGELRSEGSCSDSYHYLGLAADILCDDLAEAFVMLSFLVLCSDRYYYNKFAEIILHSTDSSVWIHFALRKDRWDTRHLVMIKLS